MKFLVNGPDLGRRTSWLAVRRLFAWLLFSVLLLAGCGGGGTAGPVGEGASVAPGWSPAGGPPGPPALETGQGGQSFSEGGASPARPRATPSEGTDPRSTGILPVKSGWNMVSFPVAEVTSLTLGEGVLETGYAYDPDIANYQRVDLTGPAGVSSGQGTARGFWVYSRQESQIAYQGWENSGARARNELSLGQGWNLVGYPYEQICRFSEVQVKSTGSWAALPSSVSPTIPASDPKHLLFSSGFGWGAAESQYQKLNLSTGTNLFKVGAAMWVFVPNGPVSLQYPAVTPGSGFEVTVEAINQAPGVEWTAGETYVTTELSATQARKLCGLLGPPSAESLRRFRKFQPLEGVTLPQSFSWTTKDGRDWLSPVKNQGPYGTCLAFASVGALEGLLEIANPSWAQVFDLSESYFWHKATDGRAPSPGGMYFEEAARQATVGTDDESVSPYDEVQFFQDPPGDTFLHSVAEATSVFGREAMKQALLKGPLVGGMPVYSDFFNYTGGIYRYRLGYLEGYHAILIVGWDDATGSWLCKNSWSTDWGEEGLFRIAYDEIWDDALSFVDVKPPGKRLVSLEVGPNPASVPAGLAQQFSALGLYSDGSRADLTRDVTWTSSDKDVAEFSVDQPGLLRTRAMGTVQVTATYAGTSAQTVLTVTEPEVVSLEVTPYRASIPAGDIQQFVAVGTLSDGWTVDLTQQVSWETWDGSIAGLSPDQPGLAHGLQPGTATIRAVGVSWWPETVFDEATLTVTP